MMREQYETRPLSELKELAKFRKIKGCSTLRKSELIARMMAEDAKLEAEKKAEQDTETANDENEDG